MKTEEFLNALCDVLGREPNTLSLDDTPESVESWDSLGHLSIIGVVDEELGVSVADQEMRDFKSIRELVDRLRARNALED